MKRILTATAFALVSGCASFGNSVPVPMKPIGDDPPFVQHLVDVHKQYVDRAAALNGESLWVTGLAGTAAIAALGFTSFKAHPDNFKAASLISGSAVVANNQLKSGDSARFMIGAANSIRCLADNVRGAKDKPRTPALAASDPILKSLGLSPTLTYEDVDIALVYVLGLAASIDQPSQRLTGDKTKAEAARVRLKTAIVARSNFDREASAVLTKIEAAVAAQRAPSLTDLLQKISEVKVPEKTEPVPSSGQAGKKALGVAFVSGVQADQDTGVAVALELLIGATDGLNPEKETEAVKGVQACLAAVSTS